LPPDTEAEAITAWNTRAAVPTITAPDEAIEAAARAMYEADDPWCKAWPWPMQDHPNSNPDTYRRIARAAAPALMVEGARLALEAAANCPHGTDGPDDGDCAFVLRQAIRALDPAAIVKGAGHAPK
jgi:hypothetical protein